MEGGEGAAKCHATAGTSLCGWRSSSLPDSQCSHHTQAHVLSIGTEGCPCRSEDQ